jgi:hypothetical protein
LEHPYQVFVTAVTYDDDIKIGIGWERVDWILVQDVDNSGGRGDECSGSVQLGKYEILCGLLSCQEVLRCLELVSACNQRYISRTVTVLYCWQVPGDPDLLLSLDHCVRP